MCFNLVLKQLLFANAFAVVLSICNLMGFGDGIPDSSQQYEIETFYCLSNEWIVQAKIGPAYIALATTEFPSL